MPVEQVKSYIKPAYRLKGKLIPARRIGRYRRKKRPSHGKIIKIDKKPVRLRIRRDNYGQIRGYA